MRFLLDENFPVAATALLLTRQHEAIESRRIGLSGADDLRLFAEAQTLQAVLLSTDADFFHTVPRLYPQHHGVVVVTLRRPDWRGILDRLTWLLDHVPCAVLPGRAFRLRDHAFVVYPHLEEPTTAGS